MINDTRTSLTKHRSGQSIKKPLPRLILDTSENVAFVLANTPFKKGEEWEYHEQTKG